MPEFVIRPVDPRNEADMDAFHEVYASAELSEDPEASLHSREEGIGMLDGGEASWLYDGFGAFLDGRMVGESILSGSLRDNLESAQVLLWVDPQHRRQRVGTRLATHIESHALSRGRRVLTVQARVGGRLDGNRLFAEGLGYTLAMTEIERRLTLPVDRALLDRLAAEAAPHHIDYEIRAFVGPVPDELRASYVAIRNLLGVEAPHGDQEIEVGRDTVADLDALEHEAAAAGRTSVTAVAVHDDTVVAYAHASVPSSGFTHVDQFGTLVRRDHRGHRLGMAVKCAQLHLLTERFPGRSYIQTSNAETNAHMVAINQALGFAVHQVWGEFARRLV